MKSKHKSMVQKGIRFLVPNKENVSYKFENTKDDNEDNKQEIAETTEIK
jgi:hypothetical protein